MTTTEGTQEKLSELFGSYRAEWLRERLYELFTEPDYFPELKTPRPCVLVGGRGTGKTTVLRCLSYQGQFALDREDANNIPAWTYYGLYYRINTNRITAFAGPEVEQRDWCRLFGHYLNIELCDLIVGFLSWYSVHSGPIALTKQDFAAVSASLNLPAVNSLRSLGEHLRLERAQFEAYINNVASAKRPDLSLQGAPVDILTERLCSLSQFKGKTFFFLLDEYENLLDYQQQVINTLVKHVGGHYTFKIGVRELGWRQKSTVNPNEQLISPADYVRIHIGERLSDRFSEFATRVCTERLRKLPDQQLLTPSRLLESLTDEEEAERLGVAGRVNSLREALVTAEAAEEELRHFDALTPLQAYFLGYWAVAQGSTVVDELRFKIAKPHEWSVRYESYKYSSLFTIRRGKRGLRKYYAGWNTLVQLAGTNVRYLLELLEQALIRHLAADEDLQTPVSAETQTRAAQEVGKKNISELEGISAHGARLTRLLLGLGRVFQVMAAQPEGHAAEMTQFHLSESPTLEVEELIKAGVMHLALVRYPGSKLQDDNDTREYDYALHPIYAPFFEYSYRKKRKFTLDPQLVRELVEHPRLAIDSILETQGRGEVEEPLTEQLELFAGFYAGNSK